ncbi:alpha/beta hydrolase [Bacteroides thetaiotaomicron]
MFIIPRTKRIRVLRLLFSFFGGGWNSGSPKQFESQASYLNKYGVTVVLADYRTQKNAGTTPKEALMDAKSAMRYLKQHAMSIHVDPDKILAGGGSAGGHFTIAKSKNSRPKNKMCH